MARIHEKIVFQDQIKYVISSAQPFYDMIKTGLNTKYGVVSGNELLHSTAFCMVVLLRCGTPSVLFLE